MNIYFTGDTHGGQGNTSLYERLEKVENDSVLLIAGDFGYVWDRKYLMKISPIEQICKRNNIEIYSVLGNHENYNVINKLPIVEKYGGKCYQVSESIFFFCNGELFDFGQCKLAVWGGGLSIDKEFRTPGKSWWAAEIPTHQAFYDFMDKLETINTKEYILFTHVPSTETTERLLWTGNPKFADPVGQQVSSLKNYFEFNHHVFGHLHDDKLFADETLIWEDVLELSYIKVRCEF